MNVVSTRNADKEREENVARWYDIKKMEDEKEAKTRHIGSAILVNPTDMAWTLNDKTNEPFGDFMQCIAELKIQDELNHE